MILSVGVITGLIVGIIYSRIQKITYRLPALNRWWLVFIAVIPQMLTFQIASTGKYVPDQYAPLILVTSQVLLLAFCLSNFHHPGFSILAIGLMLNLLIIILNKGLMPIQPDNVRWLLPDVSDSAWSVGKRLGISKDIVLLPQETKLIFLSDQFRLSFFNNKYVYSLGDIFLAIGAFLYTANILPDKQKKLVREMEQTHA